MALRVKAYANCDRAYIAWNMDRRIRNLRGFALYRRRGNGPEEPVPTYVGFRGERATPGLQKPSTEWPVQKFMWADFLVSAGDRVTYQVVPMTGTKGNLKPATRYASNWTVEIEITAEADPGFQVYFNRGIVASQWLSRRLDESKRHTQLRRIITTPGDDTRNDLSEPLRSAMLEMLTDAHERGDHVHAALFELNDPELIPALAALGPRAHVILGNGAARTADEDHNAEARTILRDARVEVHDRMLGSRHLAHNKFVVIERDDAPQKVWTGSTNWSATGLCTQANNGILIKSPGVAADFKHYWEDLKASGSNFPPEISSPAPARRVRGSRVTSWFTPVPELVDVAAATEQINAAREGILFLMFNPGPVGTIFNAIIERSSQASPHYDPNLYIHGVMNQDPGSKKNLIDPIMFMHRGRPESAGFDVVLPGYVNDAFGYWNEEIQKLSGTWAMVHSKCVVLDPFGEHPVVITGSHNLGPKASGGNDDNLVVIEGARGVATAYAVTIMGIYNDYRWRFRLNQREKKSPGSWRWGGLEDNDTWQVGYLEDAEKQRELKFWLGER